MKKLFSLFLLSCAVGVMFLTSAASATDTPTQIRFIVGHADCGGSATYEFFIGNTSIGVYSSTNGCYCNTTPLVVTINEPAVLNLIGPAGCTLVSMQVQDPAFSLVWCLLNNFTQPVIPAEAGIQKHRHWIPVFTGMTQDKSVKKCYRQDTSFGLRAGGNRSNRKWH